MKPFASCLVSIVQSRRLLQPLCFAMLLVSVSGCCCTQPAKLRATSVVRPTLTHTWCDWWSTLRYPAGVNDCEFIRPQIALSATAQSPLVRGENAYAVAERLHRECDAQAIDYWARAVAWSGEAMRQGDVECCQSSTRCLNLGCRRSGAVRAAQIHKSATIRILSYGQAYGRLDPSSQLTIQGANQTFQIPVIHEGFAWTPDDFERLLVFEPPANVLGNVCGRGVPLVVLSRFKRSDSAASAACDQCGVTGVVAERCDHFIQSQTPFAATAIMDFPVSLFQNERFLNDDSSSVGSVQLINPLTITPELQRDVAIAQSPAMALRYARQSSRYNPLAAFLSGDNGVDRPRLRFLAPYQPGKIPLIMVHGLLSDPSVFLQMAEAVQADSELRQRYQIWIFRYPTGDNVLNSAAMLRRQLAAAYECQCESAERSPSRTQFDGNASGSPMRRAVIVGHSMGGLLSKLQVTDSGDQLWRSVADAPFADVQGSPEKLSQLKDSFFFRANPNIGRVVYIATPHQGSPWAYRCIGRLGSTLAGIWGRDRDEYERIFRNNPNVFSGGYSESFPSSIEMLRPSNKLLETMASTTSSPQTTVNSMIGDSCWLPRSGRSDGVVPVTSAYQADAETTTMIDATHTTILQSRAAQQTLLDILRIHLSSSPAIDSEIPIETLLESEIPQETSIEFASPIEASLELLPALP